MIKALFLLLVFPSLALAGDCGRDDYYRPQETFGQGLMRSVHRQAEIDNLELQNDLMRQELNERRAEAEAQVWLQQEIAKVRKIESAKRAAAIAVSLEKSRASQSGLK